LKEPKNPTDAEAAKKSHTMYKCFGVGIYFLFNTVPSVWALSTDKSKGPLNNGGNYEELVIYIRNMGAVVWGIAEVGTSCLIRKLISKLTSAAGPGKKVSFIIRKLDQEMKSFIVFMSVLGSMYAVFIIPYLLPYQTYLIAFIVGLGSLRTSAKAFLNEEQAKARGRSTVAETKAKIDRTSREQKSGEGAPSSPLGSNAAIPRQDSLAEISNNGVDTLALVPISLQASGSARESGSYKEGSISEREARTSVGSKATSVSEKVREDV